MKLLFDFWYSGYSEIQIRLFIVFSIKYRDVCFSISILPFSSKERKKELISLMEIVYK